MMGWQVREAIKKMDVRLAGFINYWVAYVVQLEAAMTAAPLDFELLWEAALALLVRFLRVSLQMSSTTHGKNMPKHET